MYLVSNTEISDVLSVRFANQLTDFSLSIYIYVFKYIYIYVDVTSFEIFQEHTYKTRKEIQRRLRIIEK
jgi:hypothetical protein